MVETECVVQRYTVDESFFVYLKVGGRIVAGFEAQIVKVRAEKNSAAVICDTGVIYADKVSLDINSDEKLPMGVENDAD